MPASQIYSTTFGFINSDDHHSITISLKPKDDEEYHVLVNGEEEEDIHIPQEGGTQKESLDWKSPNWKEDLLSAEGTLELSLTDGRYWLFLKNPNVIRGNWAQVTEESGGNVGGKFLIATWTGELPSA